LRIIERPSALPAQKGLLMRIMVNDYAGHPFQIQLSRSLARAGHQVLHTYFAKNNTPKGCVERRPADAPSFNVEPIFIARKFKKHALFARWLADVAFGKALSARLDSFRPHVVLSANMPLDALQVLLQASRKREARFVIWLQDVLSVGIEFALRKKGIPGAGLVGEHYARLERKLAAGCDALVCIAPEFRKFLQSWNVPPAKTFVIENWAPLDEVRPVPRDNAWTREMGIAGKFCFMYSGTLGMKHRPELLLALAKRFRTRSDVVVVAVAQGAGADWLRAHAAEVGPSLLLLPFQPYARLSEVLGSAQVLITILDAGCGAFAVPSKSLAYLCAGRPLLVVAPKNNLAAETVKRAGAGEIVFDDNEESFFSAARRMLAAPRALQQYAANARSYAERTFDIHRITRQFLEVFAFVLGKPLADRGVAAAASAGAGL
jgi:glycosyltransferase involved in cell wall biosynthesis